MDKLEKVIKGIGHCLSRYVDGLCDDCPYMGELDKSYMIPMKCKEIIMRDALELLQEQKWIPASEKLPEEFEPVYVFSRRSGLEIMHIEKIYKGDLWLNDHDYYFDTENSWWMPLPKPPKESDQE